MKCLNCGGKVNYVNEVINGSFIHELSEDGKVIAEPEFYGDSYSFIECEDCAIKPGFTIREDGSYNLVKRDIPNKKIFLLIGPSGSGKDSLGDTLKRRGIPELVSHTTREKRQHEVDGVNYNFVTKDEFDKLNKIEENLYSGNYYGLSKDEIDLKLEEHSIVFAIVDINGYSQIKQQYPKETVSIFISVTYDEMISRMKDRGDTLEDITKRIKNAIDTNELDNGKRCDYIITNSNGEIDSAVSDLNKIILLETYL